MLMLHAELLWLTVMLDACKAVIHLCIGNVCMCACDIGYAPQSNPKELFPYKNECTPRIKPYKIKTFDHAIFNFYFRIGIEQIIHR